MNPAELEAVRNIVRAEMHTLQRESLPATHKAKLLQGAEVRAVERFNLASRTLLTLDDMPPVPGRALVTDVNGFASFADLSSHNSQQQALNAGSLYGLPRCNMAREAIRDDLAAFSTGVMAMTAIELEAGLVINRIAFLNGASAGSTISHAWAAIYTPDGAAFGRQSTDVALGTTTANTLNEFTLSASYTIPADGLYPIGLMLSSTIAPSAWGSALGNAIVARPTGATGVTFPFAAGTNGAGLTTTAPAGPLTITANAKDIAVWVY